MCIKWEKVVTVLSEFRGGFTVFLKYFGGFTVFGTPYDPHFEA